MRCDIKREEIFQVRSTWPEGIFPGEECLPYDGSKVPDCSEYIDPNHYVPYYHEHSASKNWSMLAIPYLLSLRLQPFLGVWSSLRDLSL